MNLKKRLENAEVMAKGRTDKFKSQKEYFETWQEPMIKAYPQAGILIHQLAKEAGTKDARQLIFHKYEKPAFEKAKVKLNEIMVKHTLATKTVPQATKVIRHILEPPPDSKTRFVRQPETGDLMIFL